MKQINADEFIGMTISEATEKAMARGFFVALGNVDGVFLPYSASLCFNRVVLSLVNNIVIDASIG